MMDMGPMDSMMGSMMGVGLLGWLLVIGLLVAILVVLIRLLNKPTASGSGEVERQGRHGKPLQ
jgi:uncharacterized membrane protein